MNFPVFRRGKKYGVDEELVKRIDDGEPKANQESVIVSVQHLTREALRQSGFAAKEAHSELAHAAMTYAAHILIAELRVSGNLRDWMLARETIESIRGGQPHLEIRERMGLPMPEPEAHPEGSVTVLKERGPEA